MEYKIKEGEESKPAEDRIIEKTGLVINFSMTEMYNDIQSFEKTLKGLKGNRDNQNAVCTNIEIHHPFIKDLSDIDRRTIYMYEEAFTLRKQYNDKIDEIEKQYEDYKQEMECWDTSWARYFCSPS